MSSAQTEGCTERHDEANSYFVQFCEHVYKGYFGRFLHYVLIWVCSDIFERCAASTYRAIELVQIDAYVIGKKEGSSGNCSQ
jgi:hypothetical protein